MIVTKPASYPVTREELAQVLHISPEAQDERMMLDALIDAATTLCEEYTGRAFITQTRNLQRYEGEMCSSEQGVEIPYPPLQTVDEITVVDAYDGSETEVPEANYFIDKRIEPGRVILKSSGVWNTWSAFSSPFFVIEYTCGYGATADTVPYALRHAVLLTAAELYMGRENPETSMPLEASVLLAPYVIMRL